MDESIAFRPANASDTPAVFRLFLRSVRDLAFRQGTRPVADGSDSDVIATVWQQRQSLFEHLAETAHQFWVAEREETLLGYARSILRDGMLELTEFFVSPDAQSGGIGRELLRRTFDADSVRFRAIIASTDIRAQSRYLKSGVYPQFPIMHFSRQAEDNLAPSDLQFVDIPQDDTALPILATMDQWVLGFRRDVDHRWFLGNRAGFLVYRGSEPAGYGYVSRGYGSGPFALLDPADFPAVLAHAETLAARGGQADIMLQVPMVNRSAVDYLLQRGFRMDPTLLMYMSDVVHGRPDHYLVTSPPFFV